MRILLTGATGYIGKRLLPVLVHKGHHVTCVVRDKKRAAFGATIEKSIDIIEADLLDKESLQKIPQDIDIAYYLVHSMSDSRDYAEQEKVSAINFREQINKTTTKQVIYLSGIVNDQSLSKHLKSRLNVEQELAKGDYALTTLRAGIIIGSGSASFEIIRDLVEKLPVMVAPRWLKTGCQPIAISDVIRFLELSINNPAVFNQSFDIGGNEILTYKQMLLRFAKVRGLKRRIISVPVMTPRLSSYWLYFVTSTSYKLATSLVDSMRVEVIARNDELTQLFKLQLLSYEESLQQAFKKIEQNEIISSWKDSFVSGQLHGQLSDFINVPKFGCFKDVRIAETPSAENTIEKIWQIGGENGWYYGNRLWRFRGFMDKVAGGVGLRRGRTNIHTIRAGDAIDFWRVIYANKKEGRLLLYAEMKLPGEVWLEFKIRNKQLIQAVTFRPKGLWGRIYWYLFKPFRSFVFKRMIANIVKC
ncbi:SDR family oxidoreductase [Draconibacterium sediminis]|uniref:Epimerase n=1 Tax=Draconibacterium sediminis TaxID=1544798 RepID=A0A0D8J9K7_9BACT|nr:SDR family oxidoreductase [Draconibacterium sediminis]KJF43419.1 epimerase [Draconibacterium sediminis]